MKLKKIAKVVDNLNYQWYELTDDSTYIPFELVYCTDYTCIKFLDQVVWDDQDNGCMITRESDDPMNEDDEYESLEECVVRRTKLIQKVITGFNPKANNEN